MATIDLSMNKLLTTLAFLALTIPAIAAPSQGISMRATNGVGYGNTVIHNLIVTNAATGNTVTLTNGNITATGNITNTGYSSTTTNYATKLRVGGAAETVDAVNITGSLNASSGISASSTITTGTRFVISSQIALNGVSARAKILNAAATAGAPLDALEIVSTNGFVLFQRQTIPTNSIPASSSSVTNWVLMNLTNTINSGGPMYVATNISAAGSFLMARPTLTESVWP